MSATLEQCPFCPQQFRGEFAPRNVEENAFLKLSTHVWVQHSDKMQPCPSQVGAGRGASAFWRVDHTCSYCGSLSPERLFELIKTGTLITPTDKPEKIYVGPQGKFRFGHLSEDQMRRFVDLYNAGSIRMTRDFYVYPYFMKPRERTG